MAHPRGKRSDCNKAPAGLTPTGFGGFPPTDFGGFWLLSGTQSLTRTGSRAEPSLHAAWRHRSRRPPAHAAGAQEASSAASSIPGWGRLLTSTTRSLHFMHHRASCQRSPGARLFIAAMMHESEIARRGSAGGGRQPQSSRRNWRLIYKQQICYVRLIDGKWRESPEMGSSESRFLAAALL